MKNKLLEFYADLSEVLHKHNAFIDVVVEDGVYYTLAGLRHLGVVRYDQHFYKTKCAYETVAVRINELEGLSEEQVDEMVKEVFLR